jgi:hypothetical protein
MKPRKRKTSKKRRVSVPPRNRGGILDIVKKGYARDAEQLYLVLFRSSAGSVPRGPGASQA